MAGQNSELTTFMTDNKFLFKVEQTFLITGRGVILLPGLGDKVKHIRTGEKIKLIRPDKTTLETIITGITFEGKHDICVGKDISKDDIPIGTEVWLTD